MVDYTPAPLPELPSGFQPDHRRFIACAFPDAGAGPRCLPLNPNAPVMANAEESATWGTSAEALALMGRGEAAALGAVVGNHLAITIDGCVRDGMLDFVAREIVATIGADWGVSRCGTGIQIFVPGWELRHPPIVIPNLSWATEIEFATGGVFTVLPAKIVRATRHPAAQAEAARRWLKTYLAEDDEREALATSLLIDEERLGAPAPARTVTDPALRAPVKPPSSQPRDVRLGRDGLRVNRRLLALGPELPNENYLLLHYLQIKHVVETQGSGGHLRGAAAAYAAVAGISPRSAKRRLRKLAAAGCGVYHEAKDDFWPIGWRALLTRYGLQPGPSVLVPIDRLFAESTLKQLSYAVNRARSTGTRPVESRNELKRVTGASRHTQYTVERRRGYDVDRNAIKVADALGAPLPGFTFERTPGGQLLVSWDGQRSRPVLTGANGRYAQLANTITDRDRAAQVSADTTRTPQGAISGLAHETYARRYFVGERPPRGIWRTGRMDTAAGFRFHVWELVE